MSLDYKIKNKSEGARGQVLVDSCEKQQPVCALASEANFEKESHQYYQQDLKTEEQFKSLNLSLHHRKPTGAYNKGNLLVSTNKKINQPASSSGEVMFNNLINKWQPQSSSKSMAANGGYNYNIVKKEEKRAEQSTISSIRRKKPLSSSFISQQQLFTSILLPFIIIFLLPTLRIESEREGSLFVNNVDNHHVHQHHHHYQHHHQQQQNVNSYSDQLNLILSLKKILLPIITFPFDRLRLVSGLIGQVSSKEINSKHDLQEEETHLQMLAEHRSYLPHQQPKQHPETSVNYVNQNEGVGSVENGESSSGALMAASSASALESRSDLPFVSALNVKCEKNHMTVNIVFDRPFYGMVFSKGHYNDQKCIHLPPNTGQTSVNFDIHLGKCGMTNNNDGTSLQQQTNQPNGVYIENTIIIQYDPQVQEIFDQARKLRCTWYDYYEKSVTFRQYSVEMLDAVTANFLGDNIQCWMQIQVGKGPWSSEVAGIVKIGQTMTMVLAIKDDENRFDMLVRNCVAHDGKHPPIQLVDEYGCVSRPKIMAKFQKIKNFGAAATVVSYAHFQAFKFPDSMNVNFQCVIQVCRNSCPEPVCGGHSGSIGATSNGGDSASGAGGDPSSGNMMNNNGAGGSDYAASGTEIVSSKEPSPLTATTTMGGGYFPSNRSSAVNLKLDESQGRVQVKLDTSMMAGGMNAPRYPQHHQQLGPLPPHLLQASQGNEPPLTSYVTPTGGSNVPRQEYYRQVAAGGASVGAHPAGRPTLLQQTNRAPSSAGLGHAQHFSAPYPATGSNQIHRSQAAIYSNRFGEQTPSSSSSASESNSDEDEHLVDTNDGQPTTTTTSSSSSSSSKHSNSVRLVSDTSTTSATSGLTDTSPLALIASPRALRMAANVSAVPLSIQQYLQRKLQEQLQQPLVQQNGPVNHRMRRSVLMQQNGTTTMLSTNNAQRRPEAGNKKLFRDVRSPFSSPSSNFADSTSIKTQKTIQVVSPDDVAFSLLSPGEENFSFTNHNDHDDNGRKRKLTPSMMPNNNDNTIESTVCFSAAKLMFSVMLTLAILAISIVIVVYFILKQRAKLEEKLSPVSSDCYYEPHLMGGLPSSSPSSSILSSAAAIPSGATTIQRNSQQQQQQQHNDSLIVTRQRQQEEIQQRNKYLARLYSQFVPATYWQR